MMPQVIGFAQLHMYTSDRRSAHARCGTSMLRSSRDRASVKALMANADQAIARERVAGEDDLGRSRANAMSHTFLRKRGAEKPTNYRRP